MLTVLDEIIQLTQEVTRLFAVNYKDPRPIYEQIKSGLRHMITEGELAPGEKLPSVRELAVKLAINPNTIQRAYRELESEGVVVSVQGKGCFVGDDYKPDAEKIRTLFAQLDEISKALKEAGVPAGDICARITHGGDTV